MLRVTADTNIYISAFNFGGMPERLLRFAEAAVIQLAISDDIVVEVVRVLRGDKFAWPELEIKKALTQISRITQRVQPTHRLEVITDDPDDNRILECATAEARSDFIVTGDVRHLLPFGAYDGISIVRVADFIRRLQSGTAHGRQ